MFQGKTLGVIGCGTMGEALVRGAIGAGLLEPADVLASNIDDAILARLDEELGIRTTRHNDEIVEDCDVLLFALKPQILPAVLAEIGPKVRAEQLLLSIAAGLPLAALEALVPARAGFIRIMPNTPALIGQGASAWCPGTHARPEHGALARALTEAVGIAVQVDESRMDAVTALSGSGPAYVFHLLEHLYAGAAAVGLTPEVGRALADQTLLGAARLAVASEHPPAELRRRVTSPGGTTAAALAILEERGAGEALVEAIVAARDRGLELGQPTDPPGSADR